MKSIYIIKIILILFVFGFTQKGLSQINISGGVEAAMVRGAFKTTSSKGVGSSFGLELSLFEKLGATCQLGYIYLIPEDGFVSSYMLPLQGGLKYYINTKEKGVYLQGLYGVHKVSATLESVSSIYSSTPEQTTSSIERSFSYGLGYVANKKVDIVLRYNFITSSNITSGYIGVRVGYTFL